MMREILFRGKRTDNGEWVEGFLFYQTIDGENACCIGTEPLSANDYSEILGDWVEVVPETVGQFTECTDRNGTRIFGGDIFKYESSSKVTYGVVEYRTDYKEHRTHNPAGYVIRWVTGDLREDLPFWCGEHSKAFVVGNIFDNPKLMEVEENDL